MSFGRSGGISFRSLPESVAGIEPSDVSLQVALIREESVFRK